MTDHRRQHELLQSWSGWPPTSILIDPAEIALVWEAGRAGTITTNRSRGSGSRARPDAAQTRARAAAFRTSSKAGEGQRKETARDLLSADSEVAYSYLLAGLIPQGG